MISSEILKEVILTNAEYIRKLGVLTPREGVHLPAKLKKVVVIHGVRRCGKTSALNHIFQNNDGRALYVDFEDERLANFHTQDFERLQGVFLELYPEALGKPLVFLLDEVQNVKGWERFARRATEKQNIQVLATGSSSQMTPSRFHTALRGRSWGIELFPFSFREYLLTQGMDLRDRHLVFGGKRHIVQKHFRDYLRWGGFPEVCLSDAPVQKIKILREYLEAIFFKDLVERYRISNISLLHALREKLYSSFGLKISLSAFYKQHKHQFPFSKDSLFAYYQYFLESMITCEVKMFSPSSYKRLRHPPKNYLVDLGLARSLASEDKGRRLENLVFLELRRKGCDVFYFEGQGECDLIARDDHGAFTPLQCTWELGDHNKDRELQGLVEACRFLSLRKGTILTYDEEHEERINGITIHVVPAWKWLLE